MAAAGIAPIINHVRQTVLRQGGAAATDGRLLDKFIAHRDPAAFEALVKRHGAMVLGVCRRMLRDPHDADDAFQATFLVLARKAAAVWPRAMVGNWLYGVAHTTALRARVARARSRMREKPMAKLPESTVVAKRDHDLVLILDEELARLPDKYRTPIVLCDLECRSRREVAAQLEIPEGTLSSRLTTARRMLAKRVSRRGLALSGGAIAWAVALQAGSAEAPASLTSAMVKAAVLVAHGATAPVISAKVAALMEGVVKTMLLSKLKLVAGVFLLAGIVSLTAGLVHYETAAAQPRQSEPGTIAGIRGREEPGAPRQPGVAKQATTADFNATFDRAVAVVRDYFPVEYVNRFEGRIETRPVAVTKRTKRGAAAHRHRAVIQIRPDDSGALAIEVRVLKEIKSPDSADVVWTPDGRDTELEQAIFKRVTVAPDRPTDEHKQPVTEQRRRQYQIEVTLVKEQASGQDFGEDGRGKLLASPKLIVVEGMEGHFVSGGQVAIPGDGAESTEFLNFGIAVRVKVVGIERDRMRLETVLERTELNPAVEKGTQTRGTIVRSVAIVRLGESVKLTESGDDSTDRHWLRVRVVNEEVLTSQTRTALPP